VATVTFLHSYSLSGGRGQHLLLRMSLTALHIADCLAVLLRTRRPGFLSCGPLGRFLARPSKYSLSMGCLRVLWVPHPFLILRFEWTICRALMPPSCFPATL
jgi:hypothetical protein